MKRKLLSLFLVCLMLLNVVCLPAGATDETTEGLLYAKGSFQTQTSVRTVTHGLGWIPDMIIVYTSHLPLDGKLFFAIGYSQAMLNCLGENASSNVFANKYGGMLSSSTKVGFENSDIANADRMGYIRSVTDQTFVIGGSTFGLDTTSSIGSGGTNPNNTPIGEACGNYNYIAIGGLSSGGTSHTHEYTSSVIAPSCESAGYTQQTCTICGKIIKSDETPALGHSWTESTQDPASCLTEGVQYFTCSVCQATRSETIPPTGHNYTDTVISPTCSSPGYTQHQCAACGDIYHDASTPSLGHVFVDSICTRCGILEGEQGTTERPGETDAPGGSSGGDPVDPDNSEKPIEPGESSGSSGGASSGDSSDPSAPSDPSDPGETKPSSPGGSSSGGDYDMSEDDKKVLLKGLGIIGLVVFGIILFVPGSSGGKS